MDLNGYSKRYAISVSFGALILVAGEMVGPRTRIFTPLKKSVTDV